MGRIGLLLLSMGFAVQAMAAGATQVGGIVVNYNAFMTNFLSPEITAKYGLQRSDQLGALNVNLAKADQKIASTIQGTYHQTGEQKAKPLTFKQVINDQGSIDYFAQFPVNAHRNAAANPAYDPLTANPATSNAPYRVFNIGNNNPVQLLDFIGAIESALGRKAEKRLLPLQDGDVPATYANTDLLNDWVGFVPGTTVQDGVTRFIAWYRDYYKV